MFGMLEAMLSFLRRQIGLRTDAADANGSLHAKVADVKESISGEIGTSADDRADNTVMGWLNTQVKSWQRVTGATGANANDLVLAISSVDPAKCIFIVNGSQIARFAADSATSTAIDRYVSAFATTSITLTPSHADPFTGTNWLASTFSVTVIEFH